MSADEAPVYTSETAMPNDADQLRKNLATLERLGKAVGKWTDNVQARPTGVSMHLKFENRVDWMVAVEFAQVMQRSPAMLADALRRLLALAESSHEGTDG